MSVVRYKTKQSYLIKCPECKEYRTLDYRSHWMMINRGGDGTCFNCSRMSKGETNSGSFKKGERPSPETEFKKGDMKGENNPNWKGKHATYASVHCWIRKNWGSAKKCQNKNCSGKSDSYEWANISGNYERDKGDYVQLCASCHRRWDAFRKKFKLKKEARDKVYNKKQDLTINN